MKLENQVPADTRVFKGGRWCYELLGAGLHISRDADPVIMPHGPVDERDIPQCGRGFQTLECGETRPRDVRATAGSYDGEGDGRGDLVDTMLPQASPTYAC
jgi:hypothetical protein